MGANKKVYGQKYSKAHGHVTDSTENKISFASSIRDQINNLDKEIAEESVMKKQALLNRFVDYTGSIYNKLRVDGIEGKITMGLRRDLDRYITEHQDFGKLVQHDDDFNDIPDEPPYLSLYQSGGIENGKS